VLSATSIWCLLAEFYGLCSMRTFTLFVSLPAMFIVAALAWVDRRTGDRRLWNAVIVGAVAGLAAAAAYDVFRLPFVFARQLNLQSVVPPLALFKVFPRFGAMILSQPVEQPGYSLSAHLLGWTYHFSNGLTFGIMYLAALSDAAKRHWVWGMVMAAGLEAGMLFTPYPNMFGIKVTATFIAVTLAAHLIFGAVLGLTVRRMLRVVPERNVPA
jgi:hypothetical protein